MVSCFVLLPRAERRGSQLHNNQLRKLNVGGCANAPNSYSTQSRRWACHVSSLPHDFTHFCHGPLPRCALQEGLYGTARFRRKPAAQAQGPAAGAAAAEQAPYA